VIGNAAEWKLNLEAKRMLGDVKGAEPKYNAMMNIVHGLQEKFKETYGEEITPDLLESINEQRARLKEQIQVHSFRNIQVQALIDELKLLDAKYRYAGTVEKLSRVSLEDIVKVATMISGILRAEDDNEFRTGVLNISYIANSKEVDALKPVVVRETDDPDNLINVGCVPIKTCQRWTEETDYNDCLPAYLVDANKKLVQVLDFTGRVRLRSITRLMQEETMEGMPIIFVERPYSEIVTPDLYKVLIGHVVEKAFRMSKELKKPVAVAAENEDYCKILEDLADKAAVEFNTMDMYTTFAKSRNEFEYSDGFGGKIKNSQRVNCTKAGYIIISGK
jgi:hypothetical protein